MREEKGDIHLYHTEKSKNQRGQASFPGLGAFDLGNGSSTNSSVPVSLGLSNITAISEGAIWFGLEEEKGDIHLYHTEKSKGTGIFFSRFLLRPRRRTLT